MKLTAEQVEKAIRKYAHDDSCYIFEVYGEMCRFIADELNAMLGGGECETYRDEYGIWHYSSCEKGADKITGNDGALESWIDSWPPNICPYCGAKVKAVKR